MPTFLLVWLGQIVSLFGSSLTEFALGVWVYQTTGSITQFALISVFIHLPNLLISPLAGAVVDRFSRRGAMILNDIISVMGTLILMGLVFSQRLEVWHIYVAVSVSSICSAFQWPAYMASIPQLVPMNELSRANGMVQVSRAIAKISGPTIAGILVGTIGIGSILIIDSGTFIFGFIILLLVRFPKVEHSSSQGQPLNFKQLWKETRSAWNYILIRPGLRKLLSFFAITYFTEGMLAILFWPLVLSFATSKDLGLILSISGCGMLFGSIAVSVWGGPKNRMKAILWLVGLQGLCLCLGGFKPSVILAGIGGFGYLFARPFIVSSNHTIWQSKVPFELQGRIFSLQSVVERSLLILSHISVGPLADRVLEPMMKPDGLLADSIGKIIGVGTGRGIGLLFMLIGILNIVAALIAYRMPRLRRVEKEIPDAIAIIS
ncbi:MFS transporter [Planktothrix mougeotii]|uniref:MFS transporter n=1 Tax=Planktothrix mougeotii LEGE 06226 TaxID=1828728 RepID=A0ABR9UFP5_9CYAN|nr:MFS transporter [Planktothrix mougeotii]MBE9145284.1 MFS transporter [Planktothrix mougeotii LEGE 06226]